MNIQIDFFTDNCLVIQNNDVIGDMSYEEFYKFLTNLSHMRNIIKDIDFNTYHRQEELWGISVGSM